MYKIIIWLTAQFSEIMKPEKSGTSCMKVFKKKKACQPQILYPGKISLKRNEKQRIKIYRNILMSS